MTYAVHHVDVDGRAHLEDVTSLEAALSAVEELQGNGQRSEVRVFKEVPIEVRTYYRVVAVEETGVPEGAVDGHEQVIPEVALDAAVQPPHAAAAADAAEVAAHVSADTAPPQSVEDVAPPPDPETRDPEPEAQRPTAVFQEPPSGSVVMGPPPAQASPFEGGAAPGEPNPEPRRSRFGRS